MRPQALVLCALAASAVSCSFIPPYSSVRKQELTGLNAVKLRGAFWDSMDVKQEDTTFPFDPGVDYQLDEFSTRGIEFERIIGDGFTVSFAYDKREMEVENTSAPINGEQISVGMRRYFGDRALTAFGLGQFIYHRSLEFPDGGDFELRESDDFFGIGAGGGANLALTEDFSLEAYLIYEWSPDVKTYKRLKDGPAAPADLSYNFSGPVAYVGIGFHF
jgi:hypothetical protein